MLRKLSLAALVAMGSISIASASTDLSDAIKGVTIGGYLRYRYTEDNTKTDGVKDHTNTTHNEYKAVLKTSIKASDTVSVHGTMVYKDAFNSNNSAINDNTTNNNKEKVKPFNVTEAYVNYVNAGANVKAGMMNLATPLSDHDDDRGNGLLATYSQMGITGAFGYFNEISTASGYGTNQNLAVLAVIADIKPVKAQAWFYDLSNTGDKGTAGQDNQGEKAYFLEASANVDVVSVKAQYAHAKASEDSDAQKFGAIAVTGNVDVASVTAAYLKFGKNGSGVVVGTKNADGLIAAGDILTDLIQQGGNYSSDDNYETLRDGYGAALVAKAKVGAFTPGIQYVHATSNYKAGGAKSKFNEYDADLAYQYNKKLKISGYYAILKANIKADTGEPDYTTKEGRVEVKYSF